MDLVKSTSGNPRSGLGAAAASSVLCAALACVPGCGEDVVLRAPVTALPEGDVGTPGAAPIDESAPPTEPSTIEERPEPKCPLEPCFDDSELLPPNGRDASRQRRAVRATTLGAPNTRSYGACASSGPDLIYDLDLRGFDPPITVYVEARAEFDASVAIEEGPLDDPFVVMCNEDHVPGVDDAFLALELGAERYRIVVDGETPTDAGEVELVVDLPSRTGRCGVPPENDLCETATPIDPDLPVQTFVGTTECSTDQAQPLWECREYVWRDGEVFYSLDLSNRSERVLLHADTAVPPTDHETHLLVIDDNGGTCSTTLACQSPDFAIDGVGYTRLWAVLDPGKYLLAVGHQGAPGDFGLRVELAGSCAVSNDTCQTATPLKAEVGVQSLVVWPMCGDDSITTRCETQNPSPDIFYRLDLREFPARVRVRASAQKDVKGANDVGATFESIVLLEAIDGNCGHELWCGDFDLWLEPRAYVLGLDGFRDQQGPVVLNIEIATGSPPEEVDCIDLAVARCASTHDYRCCSGDSDQCALAFTSCGLRQEALTCVCETEPACCSGGGGSYECDQVFLTCGTFCQEFDPALECAR